MYKFIAIILLWGLFFAACEKVTSHPKESHAPKLLKVEVPDSIKIPDGATYNKALVKAWVEDEDGLNDIKYVFFYSEKPDGSPGNEGYPLLMVDNGLPFFINNPWEEAGDEVAGDGIYSLTVVIMNNNLPGRYYFTFYAQDKSDSLSNAIIDSIEVYQ